MEVKHPWTVSLFIGSCVLVAGGSLWFKGTFQPPSTNAVQIEVEPLPPTAAAPTAPTAAAPTAVTAILPAGNLDDSKKAVVVKPISGKCWQVFENDLKTVAACVSPNEAVSRLGKSKGNLQQVRFIARNLTAWIPQEALF